MGTANKSVFVKDKIREWYKNNYDIADDKYNSSDIESDLDDTHNLIQDEARFSIKIRNKMISKSSGEIANSSHSKQARENETDSNYHTILTHNLDDKHQQDSKVSNTKKRSLKKRGSGINKRKKNLFRKYGLYFLNRIRRCHIPPTTGNNNESDNKSLESRNVYTNSSKIKFQNRGVTLCYNNNSNRNNNFSNLSNNMNLKNYDNLHNAGLGNTHSWSEHSLREKNEETTRIHPLRYDETTITPARKSDNNNNNYYYTHSIDNPDIINGSRLTSDKINYSNKDTIYEKLNNKDTVTNYNNVINVKQVKNSTVNSTPEDDTIRTDTDIEDNEGAKNIPFYPGLYNSKHSHGKDISLKPSTDKNVHLNSGLQNSKYTNERDLSFNPYLLSNKDITSNCSMINRPGIFFNSSYSNPTSGMTRIKTSLESSKNKFRFNKTNDNMNLSRGLLPSSDSSSVQTRGLTTSSVPSRFNMSSNYNSISSRLVGSKLRSRDIRTIKCNTRLNGEEFQILSEGRANADNSEMSDDNTSNTDDVDGDTAYECESMTLMRKNHNATFSKVKTTTDSHIDITNQSRRLNTDGNLSNTNSTYVEEFKTTNSSDSNNYPDKRNDNNITNISKDSLIYYNIKKTFIEVIEPNREITLNRSHSYPSMKQNVNIIEHETNTQFEQKLNNPKKYQSARKSASSALPGTISEIDEYCTNCYYPKNYTNNNLLKHYLNVASPALPRKRREKIVDQLKFCSHHIPGVNDSSDIIEYTKELGIYQSPKLKRRGKSTNEDIIESFNKWTNDIAVRFRIKYLISTSFPDRFAISYYPSILQYLEISELVLKIKYLIDIKPWSNNLNRWCYLPNEVMHESRIDDTDTGNRAKGNLNDIINLSCGIYSLLESNSSKSKCPQCHCYMYEKGYCLSCADQRDCTCECHSNIELLQYIDKISNCMIKKGHQCSCHDKIGIQFIQPSEWISQYKIRQARIPQYEKSFDEQLTNIKLCYCNDCGSLGISLDKKKCKFCASHSHIILFQYGWCKPTYPTSLTHIKEERDKVYDGYIDGMLTHEKGFSSTPSPDNIISTNNLPSNTIDENNTNDKTPVTTDDVDNIGNNSSYDKGITIHNDDIQLTNNAIVENLTLINKFSTASDTNDMPDNQYSKELEDSIADDSNKSKQPCCQSQYCQLHNAEDLYSEFECSEYQERLGSNIIVDIEKKRRLLIRSSGYNVDHNDATGAIAKEIDTNAKPHSNTNDIESDEFVKNIRHTFSLPPSSDFYERSGLTTITPSAISDLRLTTLETLLISPIITTGIIYRYRGSSITARRSSACYPVDVSNTQNQILISLPRQIEDVPLRFVTDTKSIPLSNRLTRQDTHGIFRPRLVAEAIRRLQSQLPSYANVNSEFMNKYINDTESYINLETEPIEILSKYHQKSLESWVSEDTWLTAPVVIIPRDFFRKWITTKLPCASSLRNAYISTHEATLDNASESKINKLAEDIYEWLDEPSLLNITKVIYTREPNSDSTNTTIDEQHLLEELQIVNCLIENNVDNVQEYDGYKSHSVGLDTSPLHINIDTTNPINELHQSHFLLRAFPHLFSFEDSLDFDILKSKIRFSSALFKQWSSRLLSHISRFSHDIRFCFWSFSFLRRIETFNRVGMFLKKHQPNTGHADLDNQIIYSMLESSSEQYKFQKHLSGITGETNRSSISRNNNSIIDIFGIPHLFLTFSFNDQHSEILLGLLAIAKSLTEKKQDMTLEDTHPNPLNFSSKQRQDLILAFPELVNEFFILTMNLYHQHICEPLFNVYISRPRFEFQSRGTLHMHLLLWLKQWVDIASVLQSDNSFEKQQLIEMFDLLVTADHITPPVNTILNKVHMYHRMIYGKVLNQYKVKYHPSNFLRPLIKQRCVETNKQYSRRADLSCLLLVTNCHTHTSYCLKPNCRFNLPRCLQPTANIANIANKLRIHCRRTNIHQVELSSSATEMSLRSNSNMMIVTEVFAAYYLGGYHAKDECASSLFTSIQKHIRISQGNIFANIHRLLSNREFTMTEVVFHLCSLSIAPVAKDSISYFNLSSEPYKFLAYGRLVTKKSEFLLFLECDNIGDDEYFLNFIAKNTITRNGNLVSISPTEYRLVAPSNIPWVLNACRLPNKTIILVSEHSLFQLLEFFYKITLPRSVLKHLCFPMAENSLIYLGVLNSYIQTRLSDSHLDTQARSLRSYLLLSKGIIIDDLLVDCLNLNISELPWQTDFSKSLHVEFLITQDTIETLPIFSPINILSVNCKQDKINIESIEFKNESSSSEPDDSSNILELSSDSESVSPPQSTSFSQFFSYTEVSRSTTNFADVLHSITLKPALLLQQFYNPETQKLDLKGLVSLWNDDNSPLNVSAVNDFVYKQQRGYRARGGGLQSVDIDVLQKRLQLHCSQPPAGIADEIANQYIEHAKYLKSNSASDNIDPLHMIVTGPPGTGKSYMIKYIKSMIDFLFLKETVRTCCPSARQGVSILGSSRHLLLFFDRYNVYPTGGFRSKGIKRRQSAMSHPSILDLKYLILDEASQEDIQIISILDRQLRDLKNPRLMFGGISSLILLDPNQMSKKGHLSWSNLPLLMSVLREPENSPILDHLNHSDLIDTLDKYTFTRLRLNFRIKCYRSGNTNCFSKFTEPSLDLLSNERHYQYSDKLCPQCNLWCRTTLLRYGCVSANNILYWYSFVCTTPPSNTNFLVSNHVGSASRDYFSNLAIEQAGTAVPRVLLFPEYVPPDIPNSSNLVKKAKKILSSYGEIFIPGLRLQVSRNLLELSIYNGSKCRFVGAVSSDRRLSDSPLQFEHLPEHLLVSLDVNSRGNSLPIIDTNHIVAIPSIKISTANELPTHMSQNTALHALLNIGGFIKLFPIRRASATVVNSEQGNELTPVVAVLTNNGARDERFIGTTLVKVSRCVDVASLSILFLDSVTNMPIDSFTKFTKRWRYISLGAHNSAEFLKRIKLDNLFDQRANLSTADASHINYIGHWEQFLRGVAEDFLKTEIDIEAAKPSTKTTKARKHYQHKPLSGTKRIRYNPSPDE